MGENSIRADGMAAVARLLVLNGHIQSLSLCRNDVGDKGAASLATALKSNKSLTHLWVIDSRIGEGGGKALGQSLARNKTIQKIDFRLNPISAMSLRFAESTCKANATRAQRLAQGLPS